MKYKDDFPELLQHPPLTYKEYIEKKVWDEIGIPDLWKLVQPMNEEVEGISQKIVS